jgi:hypothetical protein
MTSLEFFLEFFGPQTVFIGGWGTKFKILKKWTSKDKKQSNLYLNNQICIQTIKFEFKRINQEATPYYRPSAQTADSSVGAIYRAIVFGSAPT